MKEIQKWVVTTRGKRGGKDSGSKKERALNKGGGATRQRRKAEVENIIRLNKGKIEVLEIGFERNGKRKGVESLPPNAGSKKKKRSFIAVNAKIPKSALQGSPRKTNFETLMLRTGGGDIDKKYGKISYRLSGHGAI